MINVIDYSSKTTSVISPTTIIEGEIISDGSIEVQGKVNGSIKGGLLVRLSKDCQGDIEAQNFIVQAGCTLTGNVSIDYDSLILGQVIGNVLSNTIEIWGKVKGDIEAYDSIVVRSTGSVEGDISCRKIQVDYGAIINGNVKLKGRY